MFMQLNNNLKLIYLKYYRMKLTDLKIQKEIRLTSEFVAMNDNVL